MLDQLNRLIDAVMQINFSLLPLLPHMYSVGVQPLTNMITTIKNALVVVNACGHVTRNKLDDA